MASKIRQSTTSHPRPDVKKMKAAALAAALGGTAAGVAAIHYQTHLNPEKPREGSLTGEQWMQELLAGDPKVIKKNLGLSKEGFLHVKNLLIKDAGLQDTKHMSTTEQLGIYLYGVVTDLSVRKIAERFQRSTETISRTYHKVMKYFLRSNVYRAHVKHASSSTKTSAYIATSDAFFPYFQDAIGAVDGTHIPVCPALYERNAFRDQSGNITINVLAVCDFDMHFTDVLSGWEGSVADSLLWTKAQQCGAVSIPAGKYVLGDAGLPSCDQCLTPYRGVRYDLGEWARCPQAPQSKEELFNLRHARARHVIARIFGIMKSRFRILTSPRSFGMKTQVRVVVALCVLHNILVDFGEAEDGHHSEGEDAPDFGEDGDEISKGLAGGVTDADKAMGDARRDAIAEAMWRDYQAST